MVENKSFHFSNHFSVLGRILAANAKGAKNTKTVIIACLAAKITTATKTENTTPTNPMTNNHKADPSPPLNTEAP